MAGTSSTRIGVANGSLSLGDGSVDLVTNLIEKLQTGHIFNDFTLTGNIKNATLGRIVGSTFHLDGDILGKLSTKSQRDGDFVNDILNLNNPADPANGIPEKISWDLKLYTAATSA